MWHIHMKITYSEVYGRDFKKNEEQQMDDNLDA